MLVGTFPHGKLAMVGDLTDLAEQSSVERLASHPVVGALAAATVEPSLPATSADRQPPQLHHLSPFRIKVSGTLLALLA